MTHGDLVPDEETGLSVCSGDALVGWLAESLGASRVVFATDVDGVYDRPPGESGARLLEVLGPADRPEGGGIEGRADVTGAMAGKLVIMRRLAGAGREVLVVNGLVSGRLAAAVRGGQVVRSTRVVGG